MQRTRVDVMERLAILDLRNILSSLSSLSLPPSSLSFRVTFLMSGAAQTILRLNYIQVDKKNSTQQERTFPRRHNASRNK